MQSIRFNIFADYFQFYLVDAQVNPLLPEDWTDRDVQHRLKAAPNVVVVCPVRNMTVPVELEVREDEPPESLDGWNHVAECSLDLPSGKLSIDECAGPPVMRLDVTPGSYRVRAYYGALDSLSFDGLEGDDQWDPLESTCRHASLSIL